MTSPVRTKRVKEARDEAKKEIEAYKQQKEKEFKDFEAEVRLWFSAPHGLALCVSTIRSRLGAKVRPYGPDIQHSKGNKQAEDEAGKDAESKIKEIKAAGQKSQDKVIKDLLAAVFEAKPVAPTAA